MYKVIHCENLNDFEREINEAYYGWIVVSFEVKMHAGKFYYVALLEE